MLPSTNRSSSNTSGMTPTSNGSITNTTTTTAASTFRKQLTEYWNDPNDFIPLQSAAKLVGSCLRADEDDTDLYRKIAANGIGSHYYYPSSLPIQYNTSNSIPEPTPTQTQRTSTYATTPTGSTPSFSRKGGAYPPTMASPPFVSPRGSTTVGTTTTTTSSSSSVSPPTPPPLMTLQHVKSIPLPPFLLEQQKRVQHVSFLGLLAPAKLAYLTVDATVYLWSIGTATTQPNDGTATTFCSFTVPSKECIVSIGLVKPKPGIFRKDIVKWCLVVTTAREVLLCALATGTKQQQQQQQWMDYYNGKSLRLVTTNYSMSTDNIRMHSIAGTESGRIFLGGEDGCLYEMTYEGGIIANSQLTVQEQLDQFYDGDLVIPDVLVSTTDNMVLTDRRSRPTSILPSVTKRAWDTIATTAGLTSLSSADDTEARVRYRPSKCRKINRTATVSSSLSTVLPDFIVRGVSSILGQKVATGGGKIIKIVVDEDRDCLYTLSSNGWICSFDINEAANNPLSSSTLLGLDPTVTATPSSLRLAATVDIVRLTKSYLEIVQRGQIPSSRMDPSGGNIMFPGGSAAAQANVGDKEGARILLKRDKESSELSSSTGRRSASTTSNGNAAYTNGSSASPPSILQPTSIHVIPPTESSRLTLLAVTSGGIRLYLSSLPTQVISHGPGVVQYGRGGRGGTSANPLAPCRTLTLCNVRAPPPMTASGQLERVTTIDSRVEGGVPPSVVTGTKGSQSSTLRGGNQRNDPIASPLVVSCAYNQGLFVAAVSDNVATVPNRNFSTTTQPKGNIILSLCPDSIRRKVENPSLIRSNDQASSNRGIENLVVPGGVSETVTFPITTAYGSNSALFSNNTSDATSYTLPGGVVIDMAIVDISDRIETQVITNLATRSRTPNDNELSLGLPPPYVPSKGEIVSTTNPTSTTSRELVPVSNKSQQFSSLKVVGSMIANILLSRPLSYGILLSSSSNGNADSQNLPDRTKLYRLSQRDASKGFSRSAEERYLSPSTSSTGRSSISNAQSRLSGAKRSARLRPWLLTPEATSLKDLCSQHYMTSKEVVMLNAGGLHYFVYEKVSSTLASTIATANENARKDSTVTSFFTGYSYKEGCSMCLGLAVGCYNLPKLLQNDQFGNRAMESALARAFLPRLELSETTGSRIASGITSASDPIIPSLYEFHPSAISDALFMLFARLVRPFWHKPGVVITEGRMVKVQWTNDERLTPAKVELLLDETNIDSLCAPLRSLLNRMKHVLRRAVKIVPGAAQIGTSGNETMDIDVDENSYLVTHALMHQSNLQRNLQSGNILTQNLTASEAEMIARQIEEKYIHCLFRLVARTVQLLDLFTLLRRAQNISELREIDWGNLHGLTFSQLVQTQDGQDRMETLLNNLVTAYAASIPVEEIPSNQADELANLLAERCYLYFSPGSRFAYLGLRRGEEALRYSPKSSARLGLANQAAHHFRQAAQHWYSASLITGGTFHRKGKESYEQIALRALKSKSPLALAVTTLLQLEDVAAIVDVCLITASNFNSSISREGLLLDHYNNPTSFELAWEQNLYHKKHLTQQIDDGVRGARSPMNQSSSIIPYGADVTPKDAVDTCFALVFQCLVKLFDNKSTLADRMVSSCASVTDESFLVDFFAFLLENNYVDTLLRINSPQLNGWLQAKKDLELLSRYYNVQGRHDEAGRVALSQASDVKSRIAVEQRIYYLSFSLTSFKKALELGQRIGSDAPSYLRQTVDEVEETLEIARFQNRIRQLVESDNDLSSKLSDESLELLRYTLVDVSTLYNTFAAALELYDECLRILRTCRQHEPVQQIWMLIFCDELLPCVTRSQRTCNLLQDFFANQYNESIVFVPEGHDLNGALLFELGTWETSLVNRLRSLGQEFYAPGADYFFPVDFLLKKMGELQEAIPTILSPSWGMLLMADVGVRYFDIVSAFDNATAHSHLITESVDIEQRLSYLKAEIDLFQYWIVSSRSNNNGNSKQQLSQALNNGTFMSRIDIIKSQLLSMPETSNLLDIVRGIAEDARFLNW